MKVVEKVGDVIAEFGMKLEREAKKASRPKESDGEKPPASTGERTKTGTGSKSRPRPNKP